MPQIEVLDQQTIDKIAAGEVIERPASVVKELVENAIDARATAVTVEIKEGGISFVRITDNGCGIEKEQVPLAFLRHSTSKIRCVEDLVTVSSLGFRGEALSSIAAVSQVELITRTHSDFSGVRYVIEGGSEKSQEEIGAPEGTTFLVRNLFYNTPVRRKFLKTPPTEAGYISDLMERLALSHPEISFKFIVNNQVKLHTSGNSNLKEIIYHIYGRDIAANLIELKKEDASFSIEGFIGKPLISRGNRNFENYFINGRYVKSSLIAKSIEDAYKSFVMQHKYPFVVLHLSIRGELLDVNVHPTKMELRFSNQEQMYETLSGAIREAINRSELVYQAEPGPRDRTKEASRKAENQGKSIPEPFEKKRLKAMQEAVRRDSPYERKYEERGTHSDGQKSPMEGVCRQTSLSDLMVRDAAAPYGAKSDEEKGADSIILQLGQNMEDTVLPKRRESAENTALPCAEQEPPSIASLQREQTAPSFQGQSAEETVLLQPEQNPGSAAPQHQKDSQPQPVQRRLLFQDSLKYHTIIGQVFDTYWLVQMEDQLYIIDQHAAHEKVLYERTMASLKQREYTSQVIFPPMLLSLSMQEEDLLKKYMDYFTHIGFEIEHFGGREYAVTSVPGNLFGLNEQELMIELLDGLAQLKGSETPEILLEKIASMSCKAAVKGNQRLSREELTHLIEELLTLENPYHCPHGRPTIISMSKYELEKKFKRVL